MTFATLIALAAAVWLLSCAASLLGLYWNLRAGPQRWRAALVCSGMGLLSGYLGLSRIQLSGSKTVNGELVWSLNSRWFFWGALALGAVSLLWALWNWSQARHRHPAPTASETLP